MQQATAYLPGDRRRALLTGQSLPARATGAVLFADISGFTPLTETLASQFGRSRGAELLTRTLNEVYQALIDQVDAQGGSVIGFAGDAITCWFAATDHPAPAAASADATHAARRAVASAQAMQHAMTRFARHEVAPGAVAELAIKTAIACGPVRRFVVGDPAVQLIDVLAGAPLARMAAAEHVAQRGELVADLETIHLLGAVADVGVWRRSEHGAAVAVMRHIDAAPLTNVRPDSQPAQTTAPQHDPLDPLLRPWLLPAVWANLQSGAEGFLAELRPATALFVRFSGLDFEQDEMAPARLDAYIRWVQQVLVRHEGTLIQLTTGDKGAYLYAAFGAPVAHDDDAARAIAAALEVRASPDRFDFITEVQIGVSTGLMRAGAYGSTTRRTYGVLGDATNMAARLMMHAAPGQLLVSARVATLIEARYNVTPLGAQPFKGKRQPQPVFAVTGLRSPTLLQLDALFGADPLGRDAELASLATAVAQAAAGVGQVVRIEGDAGAGKSHLAAAAARLAAAQGFTVLYGACQRAGQAPYAALRPPLATLLGLDALHDATAAAKIDQVRAAVTQIDPAWLVRMPLLGDLLDLPIADTPTTAAFDPRLRREALGALVVSLFHHAAGQQPIFLLIEDIHWLDEADQVAVLALCRTAVHAPLALILVHRQLSVEDAPFFQELATLPHQVHLHLGELTAPAVAALAAQRLATIATQLPAPGEIDPLIAELVYAQTQGNPFFAEELIDALWEHGQVVQEQGAWRLARPVLQALHAANSLVRSQDGWHLRAGAHLDAVTLGLPDNVHGLVLARLDNLPEATRLTLKVASVIGRAFELSVLAAAHPQPPTGDTLRRQLVELEHRDFARLEAPPPHTTYLFKHSITQEAVYQTLLESQRRALHLAVAHGLERHEPTAIERLAHHFVQAGASDPAERARTLQYLDAAGWRARRRYANETALAYFDRALSLETRWEWLRGKAEVLHLLGQRVQEEATLLVLDGEAGADPAVLAELWANFYEATSQFPDARRTLGEALARYSRDDDRPNAARMLSRIGEIALREGDAEVAESYYRQALELLGEVDPAGDAKSKDGRAAARASHPALAVRAQVMLGLGVVLRQRGAYDAATAMLAQALARYEAQESQPDVATALTRLGGVAFLRRDFTTARDDWRRALAIRRAIGDRAGEGSSLLNIAQAYTSLGDYGAALPLLQQALEIHRAVGDRWWENAVWNALGILALTVGDYAEAQRCITLAEELCHAVGDEAGAAIMGFNLGQIAREQGDAAAALARLEAARAWAQANADPEFEAQCLTEIALTAHGAHALDDAAHAAAAALELYATLDVRAAMTTDLATLAVVTLEQGDIAAARTHSDELLEIIAGSEPHQLEYLQRDLSIAAQVMAACGESVEAVALLRRAHDLVQTRAANISDAALRRSFLENVRTNREVLDAAARAGIT